MDFFDDDDDLFFDEPTTTDLSTPHNPIEENLMNQLNTVQEYLRSTNSQINETEELTDKLLEKLFKKCQFLEDEGSDSESELYDESGVPMAKKQCRRNNHVLPLIVDEIWHRIIDNKWVIGIKLINNSNQILKEPTIYVNLKDEDELCGTTSFWEMDVDSSSTTKTEQLGQTIDCQLIGTITLDIPSFKNSSLAEGFGTITFTLEGKNLQTPIPLFKLKASDALDKSLTPRYANNLDYSLLAIKASSIEKTFLLSMKNGSGIGEKLLSYLEKKNFVESRPLVYVSKNSESFRYCLVEVVVNEIQINEIQVKIYARSTSQQNAMLHMLRSEFPEIIEPREERKIYEAAMVLTRELELRLNSDNNRKILTAKVASDLFIP